ncbi:MAG: DUF2878 domain-containing protein [Kangiella sp.]|jgi:hypothetical protein|nr:DUF2878 domain-containing protein [Kangiella sp.]MCW9028198.1 DUF2878 domain-containing protein [Kangiella sp.]
MVSLTKLNKVLNFVLLQTVWFALVIGVVYQHIWLGFAIFIAFSIWQLQPINRKSNDVTIMITLAALGLVLDSLWLQLGLISYEMQWPYSFIAPVWIVMLWMAFGLTINHSLSWIFDHKVIGILMGAIGGPVSYLAAEKFGAVTLNQSVWALAALATGWTLVMVMLITVFGESSSYKKNLVGKRETSWN